jgi:hypothetical protein
VVGYHNQGTADKNGNSIDSVETWDTPKIYGYALSYRIGTGIYYSLNKHFEVFVNIDYQGSSVTYTDTPITYNLTINSNNTSTGATTILSNSTHLKEVNPTISYQVINLGLGCEIRF